MVYCPEYNDIERYRKLLIGKKIKNVDFTNDGDEGLIITCETGIVLEFAFSGCEGSITVEKKGKL